MACCLPTCAQGSSASVAESVGDGAFWGFWCSLGFCAFCFAGSPKVPSVVCGPKVRGVARFTIVRLGGPWIRKARRNAADPLDGGDVFMFWDSSVAPLLDMRRRLKVVMDVQGGMLRGGITLSRSLELTVQWDCVLWAGQVHQVSLDSWQYLMICGLMH